MDVRIQPREVAEYPEVPDGGESMADAIPSWTQPKKAGNWDDVVLPVVARKMGLDDQYEEADGSPKARKQSDDVIPPVRCLEFVQPLSIVLIIFVATRDIWN